MNPEEKKVRHTQPGDEDQIGGQGQGQPNLQPVKQSTVERPTAIPVKRRFENTQFYNPEDADDSNISKDLADNGAKKTEGDE
jgi:hypothetical protein